MRCYYSPGRSGALHSTSFATFTGISIFPLTETVIDGTSEVWPTFGRPIGVFAELKTDKQGAFVEFYRVSEPSAVRNKAASPFRRCYLHLSQVPFYFPAFLFFKSLHLR